jgi:ribosomal protein S18 acetylase RimI-like enzyme
MRGAYIIQLIRVEVLLIRPITPQDVTAIIELVVASGLFAPDDTYILEKMMTDYFEGNINDGHQCVIDEADKPLGVAYYAPAKATDRSWYLTMIAVRGEHQGGGRGTILLQHVENALQKAGQRVLLVETSALPIYERTRMFYIKCGYEEEARIRDYWSAGDDMVVFRKVLNTE